MTAKRKQRFSTELVLGHKGVTALIVPFDPRHVWGAEPIALDDRREGWLVRGTVNGVKFEGWIGLRWGRHFLILGPELRERAKAEIGDFVETMVEPTDSETALEIAREQAKLTTAPKRKRPAARASATSRGRSLRTRRPAR